MKSKNKLKQLVAKVVYTVCEKNVNQQCYGFFYQPQIPAKVKALKKNYDK